MTLIAKALSLVVAAAPLLIPGQSFADDYPSRPITLVVSYTPGGNLDIIARTVGRKLSEKLGQPVIIENKPGANARIGTNYAAQAKPDGYTLLVAGGGQMVFNPGLYPTTLSYDPLKDFRPITLFGSTPQIFAVNPKSGIKTIKDLIEKAKASKEGMFYSTGAAPFLAAGELFETLTGVKMDNVPFKGNVQAVQAAIAGNVPLVVADLPTSVAQVRHGQLHPLAITGAQRSAFLPDTPTMTEAGVDLVSNSWTGLFAPAATPQPVIDKLYGALAEILKTDDMKAQLNKIYFDERGAGMSPAEFGATHRKDLAQWTKVLNDLHIHME